ncbi:MAG TPA: YggS family pyridoxal phosphate-dependent enzyme [Candidatus Nitrosotenuis sp.]|nr:YggS family pyridoxal phosphate-dependent enzyme [Candidatus Nitrosotenuis sp.]
MSFGDPFARLGDPFPEPATRAPEASAVAVRLARVREQIDRLCVKLGRDPGSVRLIGVTKGHPPEAIKAAIEAGLEDLGENYVQEARDKAARLPGVRWHLIGSLQRNKVNLAVDLFEAIHSLDSASLIMRVEKRCQERNRNLPGLIQVRLGGEETKHGVDPDQLFALLDALAAHPPTRLRLVGLMTIPPPGVDPEASRPHFRRLRGLLEEVRARGYPFWCGSELSMGMSDDYLVAIEEGATMIRLGRAIFGERARKV